MRLIVPRRRNLAGATIGACLVAATLAPATQAAEPSWQAEAAQVVAHPDNHIVNGKASGCPMTPQKLKKAYGLASSNPKPLTVGVIVAFHDTNFRRNLSITLSCQGQTPLPNCTSPSQGSCLAEMNQRGTRKWPQGYFSWAPEAQLDVSTIHGISPLSRIIVVEADSANFSDLGKAAARAVTAGASVVNMSFSANEWPGEVDLAHTYLSTPGITYVASSGDNGYGSQFPAAAPGVVTVGGTTLHLYPQGGYRSETAWNGSGSGCSAYVARPSWQPQICGSYRLIADVSADGDPATGVQLADPQGSYTVGGTSLAAPIISAAFALAGGGNAGRLYAHESSLHDVTTGNNGSCDVTAVCTAGPGLDGPTGLGTPRGLTAFLP